MQCFGGILLNSKKYNTQNKAVKIVLTWIQLFSKYLRCLRVTFVLQKKTMPEALNHRDPSESRRETVHEWTKHSHSCWCHSGSIDCAVLHMLFGKTLMNVNILLTKINSSSIFQHITKSLSRLRPWIFDLLGWSYSRDRVRSVNFTYVLLTVFINVAPMQQYCSTVNKKAFTHLDAKHSATLQKLRDVAQALAVGLGILEDLRRRADGKRLNLSFALFNVFNLGELTKFTKIHGLTVAHCVHYHTHFGIFSSVEVSSIRRRKWRLQTSAEHNGTNGTRTTHPCTGGENETHW